MSNIVAFVFKASDKLSAPLKRIAARVVKLNKLLSALKKKLAANTTLFKQFNKSVTDVPLKKASASVNRLDKNMGGLKGTSLVVLKNFKKLKKDAEFSRPLDNAANSTARLSSRLTTLKLRAASAAKRLKELKVSVKKFGQSAMDAGKNLFTKLTLPIGVAGGFMIKAASDAEEASQKFGVVFKSVSTEANAVSANLAKNFGLSKRSAKELLAGTGDLLSGFGFTGKAALDMSIQVQKLAVDLASFTNIEGGADRASAALTSALLGEREAVKSLGIAILEDDVKRRVSILLSKGQQFENLRQAKAFATLQLAQEQSKNAIGDFSRSQKSFANQTRIAKAAIDDMSVVIGTMLLPIATKAATLVATLARKFDTLSPFAKKVTLVLIGLAAILPPLIILVGALAFAIGVITLPITLAIAAVAGLIVAGIFLAKHWGSVKARMTNVADNIRVAFDMLKESFVAVKEKISAAIEGIKQKFLSLPGAVETVSVIGTMFTSVGSIIGKVADVITAKFAPIQAIFTALKDAVFSFGESIMKTISGPLGSLFSAITGEINLARTELSLKQPAITVPEVPAIAVPKPPVTGAPLTSVPRGTPLSVVPPSGNLVTQRSQTDVNINMNAPKGAVQNMQSSTRGNAEGLNLGLNMATSPGG